MLLYMYIACLVYKRDCVYVMTRASLLGRQGLRLINLEKT